VQRIVYGPHNLLDNMIKILRNEMLNFLMTQHLHYHNLSVVYKKSKRRLISTQHDIICMILYSLWDVMVDGCCDPQHSAINRQAAVSLIYTRRSITLLFSIYNMNRYV
jgi:hypothetical protein